MGEMDLSNLGIKDPSTDPWAVSSSRDSSEKVPTESISIFKMYKSIALMIYLSCIVLSANGAVVKRGTVSGWSSAWSPLLQLDAGPIGGPLYPQPYPHPPTLLQPAAAALASAHHYHPLPVAGPGGILATFPITQHQDLSLAKSAAQALALQSAASAHAAEVAAALTAAKEASAQAALAHQRVQAAKEAVHIQQRIAAAKDTVAAAAIQRSEAAAAALQRSEAASAAASAIQRSQVAAEAIKSNAAKAAAVAAILPGHHHHNAKQDLSVWG